ncbi:MAG: class I SAM-dependent methyltransferase [Pseudonocardiaceae bacterium]
MICGNPVAYVRRVGYSPELAANRANWDERVPSHLVAYDVEGFETDSARISSVVDEDLALMARHLPGRSPRTLSLVHLQRHIGLDTLSWARLGAQVTGIDFSPAAIASAQALAERTRLRARFVECAVGECAQTLGQQFDAVYTSVGVLPWLPDLAAWARDISALLKPGAMFYVRDSHPMLHAVDYDSPADALTLTHPYFATARPSRYDEGTTYADGTIRLDNATTYEWPHALSEIIQALLDVGLRLIELREHRTIPWQALSSLVRTTHGWTLPSDDERLPLMFSLVAVKPQ